MHSKADTCGKSDGYVRSFAELLRSSNSHFHFGEPTLLRAAGRDQLEVCLAKTGPLQSEVDFYRPGAQDDIQRRWPDYWDNRDQESK